MGRRSRARPRRCGALVMEGKAAVGAPVAVGASSPAPLHFRRGGGGWHRNGEETGRVGWVGASWAGSVGRRWASGLPPHGFFFFNFLFPFFL